MRRLSELASERRARSLLQWVARAAAEAATVEGALAAALDEVCRRMEWPVGHVLTVGADERLGSARIWHMEDEPRYAELRRASESMRFEAGVGLPGRVLESGRPLWIMDVTEDVNFPRARQVHDLGVRAALAFPVLLGRKVVAVLEFFSPETAEPDPPLLEVMDAIGTQLARVMERARAEGALKQSELRFRSVAETAHDAIVTSDEAGRIVTWNRAAERLFGHTEEEVRGQPLAIIIPERLRERHLRGMERVRQGGERHVIGRTVELDGLRRDGSEFPLELSLATWVVGGDRFFTGILRDITERREQAARLAQSERAAVEANRAKSLFLANMSHELRTPLNAILGFVQLLERDPELSSEQRESLAVITRSGEHLLGLINNVLSISKIEAGQTTLHPVDFSLRRLLSSLRELFGVRAEGRGLELRFELAEDLPDSLRGDEGKLRQVLINLIGNAVKFTDAGRVMVRAAWSDGRGRFSVEDTGPGIAGDDLERVLQPFVQGGARASEGSGLGLAISRDFVRLLGGELKAESEPGRGSRFSFDVELPLSEEPAPRVERKVATLAPGQTPPRILVVDNADDNRRLLVRLLQSVGIDAAEAADGAAGFARWQELQPQLVWMDMRMPVVDGYRATRLIREAESKEGKPRTVIIALTASAFDHDHPEILAAGCDEVVLKPFRDAQIFESLERWLGTRFLHEAAAPPEPVLSLARLGQVPAEQREALLRALGEGDDLAARRAVEAVADAELGAALMARVRNFEFDQLLALLERVP
jgi:two-component system sensor histidine kinase/response regulator